MATLLLQVAGQAAGSLLGPLGAIAGRAAGALVGNLIDQSLLARLGPTRSVEGPRLNDLGVQSSSEGSPIPRLYGRARLSGEVIWATRFEESIVTNTTRSSSKGGSGSKTQTTTYFYFGNFAIGLCEGEISRVGRIWADGKLLDVRDITFRVHLGAEDQLPDPLIEAKEGAGDAPAYRGLAYIVFDRLPLEQFGNRIPQLSIEVFRAVDDLEGRIRAVTVIPGATEFGYHTAEVQRVTGPGKTESENVHSGGGRSDWTAAIDDLQAACPNLESVALVVAWFGNDLRCGTCLLKPGVDAPSKFTTGDIWEVNGVTRTLAHQVSLVAGRAAFGGTPSDASVLAAIADLKARGLKVLFYPFLMMDVPSGNGLPDPYSGSPDQPAYPWRGSITCDPAPGVSGTVDKTPAATAQIDGFFGNAQPGDFNISGANVTYIGSVEWSLRRMVLHYAHLCTIAGGVDRFLIGSEYRNLLTVRDSADHYPGVTQMATLAGDVKTLLGASAEISYAADWSEYFGHHPQDGSNDVFFHLDPLWADSNIDFLGIDNYMPFSDWRDGTGHLDRVAGAQNIYDLDYLRGNVVGGEGYDWFYGSQADRDSQTRILITDGAHQKPWVFRYKDLKNWWENAHFDRPGGIESTNPTAWTPQSKPIVFTEAGCPAVDKGTNQPNVFVDAKSSESALPYYSSGIRDDLIQRRYLEALFSYWDTGDPAHVQGSNPVSSVYGAPMVETDATHIWTWDARPYPYFPQLVSVWSDGLNWDRGHWISGRMGSAPLSQLVSAILTDYDFTDFETGSLLGIADGFIIDRVMSARQALEPLSLAFFFDALESDGIITFARRDSDAVLSVTEDDLVPSGNDDRLSLTRAQESELPVAVQLSHIDSAADYRRSAVESRRLVGLSRRDAAATMPIIMPYERAQQMADIWLQDIWSGREQARFSLPPSRLAIEVGDNIHVSGPSGSHHLRIGEIRAGAFLEIEARSIEPSIYETGPAVQRNIEPDISPNFGTPDMAFLDLPLFGGSDNVGGPTIAGAADPWPGSLAVYRSRSESSLELASIVEAPATMGLSGDIFLGGPASRWDRANVLRIILSNGILSSAPEIEILSGANLAAIGPENGPYEIMQFANAELIGPDTWDLTNLLRGLFGTEWAMQSILAPGARFVLLDGAVTNLPVDQGDIGVALDYRFGPASHAPDASSYGDVTFSAGGIAEKPLSPVHFSTSRVGNDIAINWTRRGRISADGWDQVEIPLGEINEQYELDIFDGATLLRTISATTTTITYSEAEQIADWGGSAANFDIALYQLGETVGRGVPLKETVNV